MGTLSREEIKPAERLRQLLAGGQILVVPVCYDALTARLVERAGFEATFMGGFGVSASRLGLPDTGLISYAEMVDQGRNICGAVSIPVMGDGDTGFGNALNIKRTVKGYCQAGFAGIMLEDQVMPKRCGHTEGKKVVSRDEALLRIKAAVDAREEGADILIIARTDARAPLGLEEAIERCKAFVDVGADITFLEAPQSEREMLAYCNSVSGYKMANLIENGKTPLLSPKKLEEMGFRIVTYALTLLNASIAAVEKALTCLRKGEAVSGLLSFQELKQIVGFHDYDAELQRYYKENNDL